MSSFTGTGVRAHKMQNIEYSKKKMKISFSSKHDSTWNIIERKVPKIGE